MLDFWTRSRTVTVTFQLGDPLLDRLCAELQGKSGIYALEIAGRVLRVGQAGQRKRTNAASDLGTRLKHHLAAAYGKAAFRKNEFNDHFEFHSVLLRREMTIRWMQCTPEELGLAEEAAIRAARGGVLWEQLAVERTVAKHDPTRRGELSKRVKEVLDDASVLRRRRGIGGGK